MVSRSSVCSKKGKHLPSCAHLLVPLPSIDVIAAAAAVAKSLQSCLTLCDPMDCRLPGSSIYGILQARVLEWGAIAFSLDVISWLQKFFPLSLNTAWGYFSTKGPREPFNWSWQSRGNLLFFPFLWYSLPSSQSVRINMYFKHYKLEHISTGGQECLCLLVELPSPVSL